MAANTLETKATFEAEHLKTAKKQNNILPDSRLEIINESTIEMNFVLKELKVSVLTEKDAHYLVEFLLSPYKFYQNIDLSLCNKNVIYQIIDAVLSREDSEHGILCSFTKMRLYQHSFPESQFLASLNELFEPQTVIDSNALCKIFNELKKQIEKNFQKGMSQVFSKSLFDECSKLMERSIFLNINPALVIAQLTFVAMVLYRKHGPFDDKINDEQYKLWEQLLIDCFTITDKEIRYLALRLFRQELYNNNSHYFRCLANSKKRFYVAALALSVFSGNKPQLINQFSSLSLYRQGTYNRIFVESLIRLALHTHISSQSKLRLIEHIVQTTNNNEDRTVHYKAWTLLLMLIKSKLSSQIEEYLNESPDEHLLENLFWKLFSHTLKLSQDCRKLYQQHFNHPMHHLFFCYRQNVIQHGLEGTSGRDQQNKFDHFLIAVIQKGPEEFRNIRYDESISPHLHSLFHGEAGRLIKSMWLKHVEPIILQNGILNNCTIHCSDTYWDLFTWAIGINCLEPMWGKLYTAAHLLNGQHKVVLLKDPSGIVIGGYLFHLLLTNPHEPKPILAVGKAYIRDGYNLHQKREIQDTLDTMSRKVAEMMNLPLVAILTCNEDKEMHRKIAAEENSAGIFTQEGYVGGATDPGLDYDWYPHASRQTVAGNTRVIFEYQRLFSPSTKLTEDLKSTQEYSELTASAGVKDTQTVTNPNAGYNLELTVASRFNDCITELTREFTDINTDRFSAVSSLPSALVLTQSDSSTNNATESDAPTIKPPTLPFSNLNVRAFY